MKNLCHNLVAVICASLLLAVLGQCAWAAEAGLVERQWKIDGVERKGLVHVPTTAPATGLPVVFAFHGHGGNMQQAARSFAFHRQWPEALVVYLQGMPTPGMTDPDGKLPGWQKFVGDQKDRDLEFFDAVLATLQKEHKVDAARIFASGHSNGGQFTYLLWAARGKVLAGVAPSAAGLGRGFGDLKPKPALHVAGENDPLVSFALQSRMMQGVRRINGCQATGEPWAKSGSITGTIYACNGDTPFVSLIHPGTHRFPPEATALIVKFFKEVAVPPPPPPPQGARSPETAESPR